MAGQAGLGSSLPVAAAANGCANSSNCRWTQLEDGNWPDGSSNPYCSPCASWPPDPQGGGIQNVGFYDSWNGQGNMWDNEIQWAANTWGEQEYYSPSTYLDGSSNAPIFYGAQSLASSLCGTTTLSYNVTQGNQADIVGATVYLNSSAADGYVDGPSDSRACDLRYTLLHETGHVFAEGHSSVNSDLMYPSNNNVETIDQDAQDMMAQIYGTYDAGCDSDYCGGNADIGLTPPVTVHPLTAAQLEEVTINKANDVKQAYFAERADAENMVNSMEQQVWPQPFARPGPPAGSSTSTEP